MNRLQSLASSGTREDSNDQGSESDQGTSGQALNRGGRPANWFRREQFKDADAGGNHNRKIVVCKHCNTAVVSRVQYLQKHCLKECKSIPPEMRSECENKIRQSTVPAKRPVPGLSRSSVKQQEAEIGQYMHPKLPKQQQAVLNRKLFLLFCMNAIPFHVADSPYFLDFILSLNKSFKPAGRAGAPSLPVYIEQIKNVAGELPAEVPIVWLCKVPQHCAPPCSSKRA